MTAPYSETGLYSSEGGAVACAEHIPYPHSDTWKSERWTAIGWQHYFDAFLLYPDIADRKMSCETCGHTPKRPSGPVALSTTVLKRSAEPVAPFARRVQSAKAGGVRYVGCAHD